MGFRFLVNTFLISTLLVLVACTRSTPLPSTAIARESWTWEEAPRSFDWTRAETLPELKHASLVMDGLTRLSSLSSTKIEPALLQKWEVVSPLHYVFTLKPGVIYSNGLALTASDFVVAWENRLRSRSRYRSWFAKMQSFKIHSAQAFEVRLAAPDPFLLLKVSHPVTFPWPARTVPLVYPPTLGAYQLETPSSTGWIYTRNPTYHQEPAAIEKITVEVIASADERRQRTAQGEFSPHPMSDSQTQLVLVSLPGKKNSLPLSVRKALLRSIDTTELVRLSGADFAATPLGLFLRETSALWSPDELGPMREEVRGMSFSLQTVGRAGLGETARNLKAQWQKNLGTSVELSSEPQALQLVERPAGAYSLEENYQWLRGLGFEAAKKLDPTKDWETFEAALSEMESNLTRNEYSLLVLAQHRPAER